MKTAANGWISGWLQLKLSSLCLAEVLHWKSAPSQSKDQIIKRNDSLLISCWKLPQTCFVYCCSANQSEQLQMQIPNKCLEGVLKGCNYSPA